MTTQQKNLTANNLTAENPRAENPRAENIKPNQLPAKYQHQINEKKWQKYWQDHKIYSFNNNQPRDKTFVIDTPPPTVSGLLHMGHIFSYTQADFIARFWRMQGKDICYPIGFDDNGLPTERLVEKIIGEKASIYEEKNGKGSFVAKCKEVVFDAEEQFENLFNSIALSVDWNLKYQTISPEVQKISQASFIDLFEKNLVEKKSEPVFFDIADKTALAQADLIDKEIEGKMYEINFQLSQNKQDLTIMTTRPELIEACVAIMINPHDERFKSLITKELNANNEGLTGSTAINPINNQEIPIIADQLVQIDKGTGAVMCCTFGDETDIRWWRKHQLPLKIILSQNGKINDLSIKEAKEKNINKLKEANKLTKETAIIHIVKCAERSGVPIEILPTSQWFIKILNHKEELQSKVKQAKWFPEYMQIRLEQWIEGLAWDWCISRQRFFGVKFPLWFSKRKGEEGKVIIASQSQLPVDPAVDLPLGYDAEEVIAETDIMDTWATSSLTPQITAKGINDKFNFSTNNSFNKLFPADLRPQAHEIIRTWAFYTIVKANFHLGVLPWQNLMISGWCLASDKTKMSKSKGNVITPQSLIEEKGSDVVRYWAATSHLGADTAYSEDVFKIGQKLLTKIFNAAKFSSMNFDVIDINAKVFCSFDLLILHKLNQTIKSYEQEFTNFAYAKAREIVENFFWNDFCDNYLEICKVRSYGLKAEKWAENLLNNQLSPEEQQLIANQQQSAITTLKYCLENILKLFAPFTPHLCEEIYSTLFTEEFAKNNSINALGNCAKAYNLTITKSELADLKAGGEITFEIIARVRKWKSENNLSLKTTIPTVNIGCNPDNARILQNFIDDLKNVCNVTSFNISESPELLISIN